MVETDVLNGKKVLIVDDDSDILAVCKELLDMCSIDTAPGFTSAKKLLMQNRYDAAILDIMGVKGYDLLDLTIEKCIPTLMLTAHAMTPEDFVKSIKNGAHAFIPKEKITDIAVFLIDILDVNEKDLKGIGKWFTRLEDFFDKKFGYYWKEKTEEDPDFWKNLY